MSEIKFAKEIETLIQNRDKIPDEFWVRTDGDKYRAIWFMDRQKPSVQADYSFDQERFGLTIDGKIIWGFHSGCSCPSPWSSSDFGDAYDTRTWKEFEIDPVKDFDADWQDECYDNLKDYLLMIQEDTDPLKIVQAKNAEVRRYLMKRVGYENIRNHASVRILHRDGDSELLKIGEDSYVKVKDSSTDREYLLYVPEHIKTCKAGIAWTFGMNEDEYNPVQET